MMAQVFTSKRSSPGRLSGLLALGLLVGGWTQSLPAWAQGWTVLGPMPVDNSEFDAARLGDHIYAVGGINSARAAELWRYTPSSDSWRQLADLPEHSHHTGVAALGGRLYAVGGSGSEGDLQIYDPVSDTWTLGAGLPTPRTAMAVAVVVGKLHAIGGAGSIFSTPAQGTHEIYDPERDRWTEAAAMPVATEHVKAEVVDGRIYVISGRDGGVNRSVLQIYDPATDSWSEGARTARATSGMATGVVDGKIYVFGGEDLANQDVLDETQRYDPATDAWTTEEELPVATHGNAGATFGSSIYVLGGARAAGSAQGSDFVGRYDPAGAAEIKPEDLEAPRKLKVKGLGGPAQVEVPVRELRRRHAGDRGASTEEEEIQTRRRGPDQLEKGRARRTQAGPHLCLPFASQRPVRPVFVFEGEDRYDARLTPEDPTRCRH